jgi:hypothetical protein
MATQGLVTVVQNGHVQMKIIAGCEGYRSELVADIIRADGKVPSIDLAFDTAMRLGFGCRDCLVVMTSREEKCLSNDPLDGRFRQTFDQPRFNPRWEHGSADFIEIVNLEES